MTTVIVLGIADLIQGAIFGGVGVYKSFAPDPTKVDGRDSQVRIGIALAGQNTVAMLRTSRPSMSCEISLDTMTAMDASVREASLTLRSINTVREAATRGSKLQSDGLMGQGCTKLKRGQKLP